jgi:penicillin-binding protein 1C
VQWTPRKVNPPPAIDRNGMPLPRRVDQVDPYATQVTPSAYGSTNQSAGATRKTPKNTVSNTQPVRALQNPTAWQKTAGCLLRFVIAMLFVVVLIIVAAGSFGVYQYYRIAASLPSVEDLQNKASQFETTTILDRNGNKLYEILDPNAGKRKYVTLDKMSPYLIAATIATEDKDYYSHPGFDPVAIVRALVQNYTTGGIASGASTITQQLARALLMTPEERYDQSYERKAREIVLAAEITRRYSKDTILELYINENYYGNLSYGIEAAAETYFQTSADKLTLGQAAFLTGLPQAPSVYDVYTNRDDTIERLRQVLFLTYQDSQEKNCIDINTRQPVCVSADNVAAAFQEIQDYPFKKSGEDIRYPHWVTYVRSLLEAQYDAQTIYRSGFTVYTTLDPNLQDQAQQIVAEQVSSLAEKHVTDGALVAIKPNTGEIMAMVGSADFYNEAIAGQVNMAISPRQPGSAIKPLTYVAAFEKGWNPATVIWDVPSSFPPSGDPNDRADPYTPVNYDGRYHGPVSVRTALSNSYNIPAVKALYYVGVYNDPGSTDQGGLIRLAQRFGITSLDKSYYGLSLTLGGGEVSLLEMTGAFSVFANNGTRIPPVAITKIVDHSGNVVYQYKQPAGEQIIRPEHAYLISSILSDNNARAPMFGTNSVLNLGFPAAVKTGTTNDFRDNWTIGYTPDLAVGVWVGNADNSAMQDSTGVTGAAPIWAKFMPLAEQALTGGNPTAFTRPAGIVERVVCADSGTEPSDKCKNQRSEVFASDQLPPSKDNDLWASVPIDTWTRLATSAACGTDYVANKDVLNVKDATAVKWITGTKEGQEWAASMGFNLPIVFAPERACKADDPRPNLQLTNLFDGQTVTTSPLDINGAASVPNDFEHWRIWWGAGDNPSEWKPVSDRSTTQVKDVAKVYSWDMKDVPAGRITLRLHIEGNQDEYADKIIHLNIQVPTATPTLTPTLTPTSTATSTPTATPTVPTATPVPPTSTPIPPTDTPLPTETPTPEPTNSTPPAQQSLPSETAAPTQPEATPTS